MKTNLILIVVTLLAYWIGLCNASAFYDPGTQRWLNRDPLGERGSKLVRLLHINNYRRAFRGFGEVKGVPDLFEFVRNSPLNRIDLFGLDDCGCLDVLADCLKEAEDPDIGEEENMKEIGKNVVWDLSQKVSKCYSRYFGCLSGCPSSQLFCQGTPPPILPPPGGPPNININSPPVSPYPQLPSPPWFKWPQQQWLN
jgi:hypothetical protein